MWLTNASNCQFKQFEFNFEIVNGDRLTANGLAGKLFPDWNSFNEIVFLGFTARKAVNLLHIYLPIILSHDNLQIAYLLEPN